MSWDTWKVKKWKSEERRQNEANENCNKEKNTKMMTNEIFKELIKIFWLEIKNEWKIKKKMFLILEKFISGYFFTILKKKYCRNFF